MSFRLCAPTSVYSGPFSVRGSERFARNHGMNENFEILRKISKCPSKCRAILSGSWQFCSSLVLFLAPHWLVPWDKENYFMCSSIGNMFGSTAAHYEGAHYTVSSIVQFLCLFRLQMLSALYLRSSSPRLSYRVAFHKAERISGTCLRY